MAYHNRYLRETVTYWKKTGYDGYGSPVFGDGYVQTKGRWERKQRLVRNSLGNEVVSADTVYLSVDLDTGDYVYRGASTDSTPPTGSYDIEQIEENTSLDGRSTLKQYIL